MEPRVLRIALRIWVAAVLLLLFIPILLILLYAFDRSNVESADGRHLAGIRRLARVRAVVR